MFASVEDVKASASNELDSSWIRHELMIREKGSEVWILQPEISSGMLRALVHLIELTLAPRGSVIVIDEFENSLGINCMPQLTDFILSRASDLQFIITSHHPYVINKIPPETWKLVTRKGGCVRVISAKDIPSLQKISHQQAFIRLINLPEFEEGIA
jgi:predicted ATPase